MLYGNIIFHRNLSYSGILETYSKFQANLTSFEVDPWSGNQTTFHQKYQLRYQLITYQYYLERLSHQFNHQVFSQIELIDQNREDGVILALQDSRHDYFLFNFVGQFDSYLYSNLLNRLCRKRLYFTPNFL